MADPKLDGNKWYYIYVGDNDKSALWSTNLYNQGREGAIFLNSTQTNANTMRWQIYPINRTTYVLRSKEGGVNAFVGTHYVAAEETEGHTRPYLVNGTIADDSVFWQFGSWGDDSWWLTNARNGTNYHLSLKANGLLTIDPNTTAAASQQQNWKFGSIAKIDDSAYSSVNLPGVTMISPGASAVTSPTRTPATIPTSAPTSSPAFPTSVSPTGLSTAGRAGLGGALGTAALVALVVLGLFYWRKRNKNRAKLPQKPSYELRTGQGTASDIPEWHQEHYRYELGNENDTVNYEMPAQTVVEVDARSQSRPAELEEGARR